VYGVLRLAQMYDMTTLTEAKSMRLEVTADEVYMLPPPYMHHPHQQTPVYLEEQTGQKGDQPLHDPVWAVVGSLTLTEIMRQENIREIGNIVHNTNVNFF